MCCPISARPRITGWAKARFMVRAANTGISGVVDPYGRDVAQLALGVRGVIDSALPLALPPTPFSRYGNAVPLALALLFLGVSALFARKRRAPNI